MEPTPIDDSLAASLGGSIWACLLAVPAAALLSVLAALLDRSGPIRLRHWAEEARGRLLDLFAEPPAFEAFRYLLSVASRLGPLAVGWSIWSLLERLDVRQAGWLALAAVLLLLLVVEWTNRLLVEVYSEEALGLLTAAYRFLHRLLSPLVWLLAGRVPHAEHGEEEESEDDDEDEVSEQEIDAFIDVGRREGILEPEEEELLRSIVDFGDTLVRSVMTPRVEIVAAPVTLSAEELAGLFFESKHARIPLYRDSIDHVVGLVHIRDLFEAMHREGPGVGPESIAKPAYHVPENKTLRDLLEELQTKRQPLAIVLDEYGGVAGLVTVEDLVEEIVGDIADEHESVEDGREELPDGWRLSGRTHLEEMWDLFEADFDGVPYETLSGLICGELGYVPPPGAVFNRDGLEMTIEEADERRVKRVVVRRSPPGPASDAAAPPASAG